MTAIDSTFVSTPGATVYLKTGAIARISNCTFLTKNTSTAGHNEFIYTSGINVDYGNCTPGRNPGASGENIFVPDGSFTGCPFPCALGMWGRGGSTAALREMQTGCGVGCETCPEGAVCDATALSAPNYCPVGHYNPDRGSQTASGCRECERCVICLLLHVHSPPHQSETHTYTRALYAVGPSKPRLLPSSAPRAHPAPSLRARAALPATSAPWVATAKKWVRAPPLCSSCAQPAAGQAPLASTAATVAIPVAWEPISQSLAPATLASACRVPWARRAAPLVRAHASCARPGSSSQTAKRQAACLVRTTILVSTAQMLGPALQRRVPVVLTRMKLGFTARFNAVRLKRGSTRRPAQSIQSRAQQVASRAPAELWTR